MEKRPEALRYAAEAHLHSARVSDDPAVKEMCNNRALALLIAAAELERAHKN